MKKILLCVICCFLIGISSGQSKKILPESTVRFTIKNAGIKVAGDFSGVNGTISFDPSKHAASFFDVSLEAKTVHTGNSTRDGHLRKKEYFDVTSYPKIYFKSTKTERTKTGFLVTGTLTIKGKSKEIAIPFGYKEEINEASFNGSFQVNRLDFGVGESSWVLADDVTVSLIIKVLK